MRESQTHEQLISLQRLCLDSRRVDFEQAVLSLADHDGTRVWSATLRGIPADSLGTLQGDLSLRALSLDGRTIEGRVSGSSSLPPGAESPTAVELEGLGSLLIQGRELWGG